MLRVDPDGSTTVVLPLKKDPRVASKAHFRSRSKAGNVRGKVVDALRKKKILSDAESLDVGDTVLVRAGCRVATRMVFVWNTCQQWNEFKQFCRKFHCTWKLPKKAAPTEDRWKVVEGRADLDVPVQERPTDGIARVEVSGPPASLKKLRWQRFVHNMEMCLDVGAPRFISKGGHWNP